MNDGLLLPGWFCAACGTFNGTAKENLQECRGCQRPREGNQRIFTLQEQRDILTHVMTQAEQDARPYADDGSEYCCDCLRMRAIETEDTKVYPCLTEAGHRWALTAYARGMNEKQKHSFVQKSITGNSSAWAALLLAMYQAAHQTPVLLAWSELDEEEREAWLLMARIVWGGGR